MKDFEQIYEACKLLSKHVYQDDKIVRLACPKEGILHILYDVEPQHLSFDDRQKLKEYGVVRDKDNNCWKRFM